MTALVLDGLVAHRGRPLFRPVTQVVGAGTLLGLVGPNGAGKSSLLAAIVGSVTHTGTARYGPTPLPRLRPRALARVLSLMTQDASASNELRVREVVEVGARAGGRVVGTAVRAGEALERLGIGHLAGRSYARLSGGERQLVQVARVLAQDTPVMLLDEPTAALDLSHQLAVMHVLKEQTAAGRIVVVTMHDLTQALRWADRVGVVADGAATFGPPTDVITADLIRRVYGVTAEVFPSPTGSPTLSLVRPSCPTATAFARRQPAAVHA